MSTPIRRDVFDELTTTVRAMLANEVSARVLFLTGEAGIGKTTLLNQLMLELEADAKPPITAMAECSTPVAGSGVGFVEALKPFADVMSALVEAGAGGAKEGSAPGTQGSKRRAGFKLDIGKFFVDTAPSWIGLIPVIGGPIFHALNIVGSGYDQVYLHNKLRAEGASAAGNQEQVFRQYVNFLKKVAAEVPVLVILDDFHWADTSSTNLLFAAARDLAQSPVVFLVSYREDDVKRLAHAEEHALPRVRDELERYSMSTAIVVPPADLPELHGLLQVQYPDYVTNEELEAWLLRITGGNLLFATQFLSTLEHDKYIEERTGALMKDLSTVPVPSGARAVVAGYIRRLTDDDRDSLRFASVEGETITAQIASRLLEMTMLKVIPRLRLFAEKHHILRALGTQTLYTKETTAYQFVHFLVHKALYDDLAHEERTILHGIAADVLTEELATAEATQHNVHGVASRLAVHARIAERYELAAEALLKGAQWVWKSYASSEALLLLDQCAEVIALRVPPSSETLTTDIRAKLLRGAIYQYTSQYVEALQCFEAALALAETMRPATTDSAALRGESYHGMSTVKWLMGRHAEAEEDATVGLQMAVDSSNAMLELRLLAALGHTYFERGLFDKSMEFYQRSHDLSLACGYDQGRAVALNSMGNDYAMTGNFARAAEHHMRALEIQQTLNNKIGIISGHLNLGVGAFNAGDYDTSIEHYEKAFELAKVTGALREQAHALQNMSSVRQAQGQAEAALALAKQSLAIAESIGYQRCIMDCTGAIGQYYYDTNHPDKALTHFSKCVEMATEMQNHHSRAAWQYHIAHVHLFHGRAAEALPFFEECTQVFADHGVSANQHECAFAAACSTIVIERAPGDHTVLHANALRDLVRGRVDTFDEVLYDQTIEEWTADLEKLDITLQV